MWLVCCRGMCKKFNGIWLTELNYSKKEFAIEFLFVSEKLRKGRVYAINIILAKIYPYKVPYKSRGTA